MAASMVVTANQNPFLDQNIPYTLQIDWISHTDGAVSLNIASTYSTAEALKRFCAPQPATVEGVLRSVETIPGLLGDKATSLPTPYDVQIQDPYGYDVLNGSGAGRSATEAQRILLTGHVITNTELTLVIANAGSGTKGRILLEYQDMGYGKI